MCVLLCPSWKAGSPTGSWFRGVGAELPRCGAGHYFTGDGAYRTEGGYYQITGRMDDVINISGHRLGTAEIEDAMVSTVGYLCEALDLLVLPTQEVHLHVLSCVLRRLTTRRCQRLRSLAIPMTSKEKVGAH